MSITFAHKWRLYSTRLGSRSHTTLHYNLALDDNLKVKNILIVDSQFSSSNWFAPKHQQHLIIALDKATHYLYDVSRSTNLASHPIILKLDNNFDPTTGWIGIPTWNMQAHYCVEIKKDMQVCEGIGHTHDGGVVVRSPLKSTSQPSRAILLSESCKSPLCNTTQNT